MNTSIRAKATGITTMASWLANFMIGQVSPKAFASIGWRYYLVFTICSFSNAIVFYVLFPETKGRTLEEMDHMFRTMNPIVPLAKLPTIAAATREHELANSMKNRDVEKGDTFDRDIKAGNAHNDRF